MYPVTSPSCGCSADDLPKDITLEQLKTRYLDLMQTHGQMRERMWEMESQIDAYKRILKPLL